MANQDKKSTPLRILATFYFQPSWLFNENNEDRINNANRRNLLIYCDADEASGGLFFLCN